MRCSAISSRGASMRGVGRTVGRFVAGVAAVAALGLISWAVWPPRTHAPTWAAEYDVAARPPESLAPGTVVGRSAPAGWSHLIIKSLPRVRPGEESKIPLLARSQTVSMARWMFTAFVADVRPEPRGAETRFHLRAVALGLGTATPAGDTIITPETADQYGVELGWVTRTILTKGYETQRLTTVVAHGPTFALVDTPVWYRCGEKHQLIRFRYALLVDAPSGRLDVLVWLHDPQGECADGSAVVLAPDSMDEAELIPDPKEFSALGIPSDKALAVDRLPRYRARLLLPPDLQTLAAQGKYTPAEAGSLEAGLRQLLDARK
jgi:hypothetical protein